MQCVLGLIDLTFADRLTLGVLLLLGVSSLVAAALAALRALVTHKRAAAPAAAPVANKAASLLLTPMPPSV